MKILGIILLAFLVIYKDVHGSPFQQGWWGILGLIGWTYAVCAVIYLFTRESLCKILVYPFWPRHSDVRIRIILSSPLDYL